MFVRSQIGMVTILFVSSLVCGCQSGTSSGMASRKESYPQLTGPGKPPPHNTTPASYRSGKREIPALEIPGNPVQLTDESHAAAPQANAAVPQSDKPQRTCPIDGSPLGNSGQPVAVTLKGEPVFVCCQSCAKKAEKDPDKTLSRVRDEISRH
jgi:hypothetical protein